ncbi:hypothetical protein ACP_0265 [Acidobacterium capsulatum ATCC 51196]|uniref:Uncharacterized protein n=1 Tax=Acidobacterium capsulatum (strain ATCC 51196 / DSM 11244 / BCRC 80197 / JCM 7670 / NBRC 15755 / NCIMB 13165 / 161) TaxID=240015 RepID=C1F9B3_ACIC5|nr:hypothetical protein ACP_0265 [Acidobacterium capsulatum ATCC 51196]
MGESVERVSHPFQDNEAALPHSRRLQQKPHTSEASRCATST